MAVFPTRTEWKALKVKYGIPDVVKSGSFGAKMDALTKEFVGKKLDKVTHANAAAAATVFPQIIALADEWLMQASKLKDADFKNGKPGKDGKGNRTKATDEVKEYRKFAAMYVDRYASLKDPFLSARVGGRDKCHKYYRAAVADPSSGNLHDLYNSGIRNDLGMGFQLAHKDGYAGAPEVVKMLKQYNQDVAKWNDIILNAAHGGPADIAAKPAKQKIYLADMKALMDLGDKILAATK